MAQATGTGDLTFQPKFKSGDRVRVLRWAQGHQDGWENAWVQQMNSAIGQVGTVAKVYPENKEVILCIPGNRGDGFYYPESVLELETPIVEAVEVKLPVFGIGNLVQVLPTYGLNPKLVGHIGTIIELRPSGYIRIKIADMSDSSEYLFAPKELALVTTTVTSPAPSGSTTTTAPKHIKKKKIVNMAFVAARNYAVKLGREKKYVTIDMVQDTLRAAGYTSKQLGNAAGQVFRGKNWIMSNMVKSRRKSNHGRSIPQWRYIGD